MKNSRFLTLLTVPFLAFSLVACGDDDVTGNEGDELTQAETEAMTEILVSQGFGAALGFGLFGGAAEPTPPAILDPARAVIDESFGPFTEECPLGGDVTWTGDVVGEVDDETGEGELDFDFRTVHDGCGLSDAEDDFVFFFTGDDAITSDIALGLFEQLATFDGTTGGGVRWELDDGRAGRCGIDLSYDIDIDFAAERITGSIQGSVCGTSVSENFDDPFTV